MSKIKETRSRGGSSQQRGQLPCHQSPIIQPTSRLSKMPCSLLFGLLLLMEMHSAQGLLFRDHRTNEQNTISDGPYFDEHVPRNVTTAISQTAFLHCRVHQRGDKEVSWMRQRDMHILSAGVSTYTSDLRFQVIHPDKSENWTLQIKSPQERDSGVYECQVSTEPKMFLNYTLNVVEPRALIKGPSDLYVKTGSLLTLTCLMSQGPHDLGTVAWYRDNQPVVTSSRSENDVNVEPRITVETEWSDALESRLTITSAKLTDSGNYSCVPTIAKRASVNVHVINGEHPAAMQHGNTAVGTPTSGAYLLLALIIGQFR